MGRRECISIYEKVINKRSNVMITKHAFSERPEQTKGLGLCQWAKD
jgi:hypothetical protein